MSEKIIAYFAKNRLLVNLIYFGVLLGAFFLMSNIKKEEMPNIVMDFVRVSVSYPGATPEEVEYFVTREIEERVRGIDGIGKVNSTSAFGSSSVRVELQPWADRDAVIQEIRTSVLDARLPSEVLDPPNVREFKASLRSVISIGIYFKDLHLLDDLQRSELQKYSLLLEEALVNLPVVNSVNRNAYRLPEISVEADPEKLNYYNIPLSRLMTEISSANVRIPAGSLEDLNESRVTLWSQLDSADKIKNLIVQGGFEGQRVLAGNLADIRETFRREKTIQKINGREGIQLTVVKNGSAGILEATDAVNQLVLDFRKTQLQKSGLEVVLMNDGSYDVRNRLSIILNNGAIGIVLVLATLLLVLNRRTAFWVAVSIPFTFAFTIIAVWFFGYTINNMTLAAVIIVMGMIVDNSIIVAENISRFRAQGMEFFQAAYKGTAYVLRPVIAGVLTTCVAFIPFFMFTGRFGKMLEYLPPVVFFMLLASLFEALFILPGHMNMKFSQRLKNFFKGSKKNTKKTELRTSHWFESIETAYGLFLRKALRHKLAVFSLSALVLLTAGWILVFKMKFVMFPNEETRFITLIGEGEPGWVSSRTATEVADLEAVLISYLGKEIVAFRTDIARSRWRSAEEHKFSLRIEVVPKENRRKNLNDLIEEWEKGFEIHKNRFKKLQFSRSWWGQDSGTPVVIQVRESNDKIREEAASFLAKNLEGLPQLENVEIDKTIMNPEYKIEIDREKAARLGVNAATVQRTLRASLEGAIIYEIKAETETWRVRVTIPEGAKRNLEDILKIPVENRGQYLVPLGRVVKVEKTRTPAQIERENYRRLTNVYAGIKVEAKSTPLEMARYLEDNVFPEFRSKFPGVGLMFDGEIKDSRESGKDFQKAIMVTLLIIYFILIMLFQSVLKPLLIILTVPFGAAGVILAFWAHGMEVYGFFSVIGVIGLLGVVINNSILMLVKLEREYDRSHQQQMSDFQISEIGKTRLQAVLLTTVTTVVALFPTAYGLAGYDSMLAEMMLAMGWGLLFGTLVTLVLVPCAYGLTRDLKHKLNKMLPGDIR
jgi:multidrug efflux pump subunit AcrB